MSRDLMSELAIRTDRLGKQYFIGGPRRKHDRLGSAMAELLTAPVRRASNLLRGQAHGASELDEVFWALKDVSLDVRRGEVVGIVGRNGAGKSTLLKVLSGITHPTSGHADVWGRVGSLLEVGTGFHPELTGRENIYLNGAILGMRRTEIDAAFDEIVDFAEVDQFLETPVKHYSSGMYVRLAFAVAANLETDILMVDEVLAVGDAAFQKKCLGKMNDVTGSGRTVLFVSHNMGLIETLCPRAVLIEEGKIAADGASGEVIARYLANLEQASRVDVSQRTDRSGQGSVRVTSVDVSNTGMGEAAEPGAAVLSGSAARFEFGLEGVRPGMTDLAIAGFIYDERGQPAVRLSSFMQSPKDIRSARMVDAATCDIDELLLLPGRYSISVQVYADGDMQDSIDSALWFDVAQGRVRDRAEIRGRWSGSMVIPHKWTLPG